jgi:hypothetical protein
LLVNFSSYAVDIRRVELKKTKNQDELN